MTRLHFRIVVDTKATPEQMLATFTDFTDRRLEIWRDSPDPDKYEAREVGDTWAVAREGSASPSIWAVERYDWSEPGTVKWAAEESNFCRPGSGVELTISANPNGGSRIEGVWHRVGRGLKRTLFVALARLMLPRMLPRAWPSTLDRFAEAGGGGTLSLTG